MACFLARLFYISVRVPYILTLEQIDDEVFFPLPYYILSMLFGILLLSVSAFLYIQYYLLRIVKQRIAASSH